VLRKEPSVWGANGVGILLSIFYFLQFLKYAPVSSETLPGTKGMHIQGFLTTASIIAALAVTLPNHTAATIIGNIGIAFCILMFASPLVAMKTVIQTKSAESIPLPLTLASIACCFSWAVTGLKKMRDPVVYVPNLIGLVFGLVQLALKLVYGNGNNSAKDIGYAM
jgi:solute carrier family 50 protein (sugar transporter)